MCTVWLNCWWCECSTRPGIQSKARGWVDCIEGILLSLGLKVQLTLSFHYKHSIYVEQFREDIGTYEVSLSTRRNIRLHYRKEIPGSGSQFKVLIVSFFTCLTHSWLSGQSIDCYHGLPPHPWDNCHTRATLTRIRRTSKPRRQDTPSIKITAPPGLHMTAPGSQEQRSSPVSPEVPSWTMEKPLGSFHFALTWQYLWTLTLCNQGASQNDTYTATETHFQLTR